MAKNLNDHAWLNYVDLANNFLRSAWYLRASKVLKRNLKTTKRVLGPSCSQLYAYRRARSILYTLWWSFCPDGSVTQTADESVTQTQTHDGPRA